MKSLLRILMTTDTVGGVWTYCLELAAALASHGVEIALATMGTLPTSAQRAEVARLGNVHLFTSEYKLEWMEQPWADVDEAGEWLLELAAEFQPDAVHLNGYAHAALPWDVPVVVVAHSCVLSWWQAVKRESPPAWLAEYGHRVAEGLRGADMIVAPSHAMLEALREQYAFATPACVTPNSRRSQLFPPGEKRPLIFSAGRIWDEAKNTAVLERIASTLEWPVHLAGPEAPPEHERTEARRSSAAVFVGQLPPKALAKQLAGAAIYAAPARYEPFGIGILEAALAKCALVLADIPSLRENWAGAAVFVPPEDDDAWRDALNELARDDVQRLELAAQARSRAVRFTPRRTARAYFDVYQTLAATRSQPALEGAYLL